MNLSARAKKILIILLEEDAPMSVIKLAEKIGVSKRTVQRELEYLPKDLLVYNLKFASKTGVGVWVVGDNDDKSNLLSLIKSENYIDDTDKEYRRKKLVLEILKDKDIKKLFWYSTKFKVSEATISSDLEALEDWFAKYDLKIIKKPGSGISVNGTESSYRRAIKAFISDNIDERFLLESYEEGEKSTDVLDEFRKLGFLRILGDDTVSRVMDCINRIDNDHINSLTEQSYIGLIMHISIAVKRILDNETIEEAGKSIQMPECDIDYDLANKITIELEDEFEIDIPTIEISYIYLHIKASKYEKINNGIVQNFDGLKVIADEMIYSFDEKIAYLLKQDEEFIHSFLTHLAPTIVRLTNGMKIYNPMLEEVKAQYSDVYSKCEKTALVLQKHVGYTIPAAEIGFLTVHFAAALVRLEATKEKTSIVKIGIVCSSGIGISRLMLSKLKKTFPKKVRLTAYGKNDITDAVIKKEDFLISSLSINVKGIEVVEVNPLISENDIEKIRRLIDKYESRAEDNSKVNLTLELEAISFLATQMRTIANEMDIYTLEKNIDFLNAVEQISQIVCEKESDSNIVANDIISRENISSQIFPEYEFALFHARSEGVSTPSFNIFTNDERTNFTSNDLKGIKIIFVMLIPKDENEKVNSEILGCISSSLIEDTSLIDTVLAGENESAIKHVSKTLKAFFAEYIVNLSS